MRHKANGDKDRERVHIEHMNAQIQESIVPWLQ